MLALIACICFAVAAFDGDIFGLHLLPLGLAFLAAHHIAPWTPWRRGE